MISDNDVFASRIFLNAALPLVKVLANEVPALKKAFAGKSGIIQISAVVGEGEQGMGSRATCNEYDYKAAPDNRAIPLEKETTPPPRSPLPAPHSPNLVGTHFVVYEGDVAVGLGPSDEKPDVELRFASIPKFNAFFRGNMAALPKISGVFSPLFIPAMKTLLKLSSLLMAKKPPADEAGKELLVKLYFYLLANGVSQLNKAGQPAVRKWAASSPDRVYAFRVIGKDELAAFIRVKAGKTRAARGRYTRALPFFCLAFRDVDAALGTLLQIDDLFEASCNGKIIMEGAPEFGSTLGDFMLTVAALAK